MSKNIKKYPLWKWWHSLLLLCSVSYGYNNQTTLLAPITLACNQTLFNATCSHQPMVNQSMPSLNCSCLCPPQVLPASLPPAQPTTLTKGVDMSLSITPPAAMIYNQTLFNATCSHQPMVNQSMPSLNCSCLAPPQVLSAPLPPAQPTTLTKGVDMSLSALKLMGNIGYKTGKIGFLLGKFLIQYFPKTEIEWSLCYVTIFTLYGLYWLTLSQGGYHFRRNLFFSILDTPFIPAKVSIPFFSWALATKLATPNMFNEEGITLLEKALTSGDEDLVCLFLNASLTLPNSSRQKILKKQSMITLASIPGKKVANFIQQHHLFDSVIPITMRDTNNTTMLHKSVEANNVMLTQLILEKVQSLSEEEKDKFINQTDSNGKTALHQALAKNSKTDPAIIKSLILAGANTEKQDVLSNKQLTPLELLMKQKNGSLLQSYLESLKDSEKEISAVINSSNGRTLLHTAIIAGYPEGVRLILEQAKKLLKKDEFQSFVLAKTLEKNSALFLLILPETFTKYDNLEELIDILKQILQAVPSSIGEQDGEGNTILHILASYLKIEILQKKITQILEAIFKTLHCRNLNLAIKNNKGLTAYNVCGAKAEFISTLYKYIPAEKVNQQDRYGNTLLHYAAGIPDQKISSSLIKILLEKSAKRDQPNNVFETPLDVAERFKNEGALKEFYAQTQLKNNQRQTPVPPPSKLHYKKIIDTSGNTVLHQAAAHDFALFRKLYPLNPSQAMQENYKGENCLDIAYTYCNIPVINYLESVHLTTGSHCKKLFKPIGN